MTSVADSLADGCDTAAGQGNRSFRRPCGTLVSFGTQLNNAHPEGWRDRPCEAPATYRACMPVVNGEVRDLVPTPARGQGDRSGKMGKEKASPVTTATTQT